MPALEQKRNNKKWHHNVRLLNSFCEVVQSTYRLHLRIALVCHVCLWGILVSCQPPTLRMRGGGDCGLASSRGNESDGPDTVCLAQGRGHPVGRPSHAFLRSHLPNLAVAWGEWLSQMTTNATCRAYKVEPLVKDTLKTGHNRNNLRIIKGRIMMETSP